MLMDADSTFILRRSREKRNFGEEYPVLISKISKPILMITLHLAFSPSQCGKFHKIHPFIRVRVLKATLAVDTGTTYSGTARVSKPKTNHEVKDFHRSLQPALPNHHRTSDSYRSGLFKGGSSLETANWNTIC